MKEDPWHTTPKVSITIIVTLLAQLAGGIWAFATLTNDVSAMKMRIARQDEIIEQTRATMNVQAIQLGRIEEYTRATQQSVERILVRLERATP
jgi:hypothetical protein